MLLLTIGDLRNKNGVQHRIKFMLKFDLKLNDKHFNKPICLNRKSCGF